MSFIEKIDPVVMNIKLTSDGRRLLSEGSLNFRYFTVGDSEIDYEYIKNAKEIKPDFNAINMLVMKPTDMSAKQKSFVTRDDFDVSEVHNEITSIPKNHYVVSNKTNEIGFFDIKRHPLNGNALETAFKTGINYVKQPDLMVKSEDVTGGTKLVYDKSPNYGGRLEKPEIGDYVLVRYSTSSDTTGYTLTEYEIPLMYKIIDISETKITVDRELPNFSGLTNLNLGVMVYYNTISFSGDTVFNMSSTEYLDESVLTFLSNCQSPTVIFPYWNLSIVYTEDIAGIVSGSTPTEGSKQYPFFDTSNLGGFVKYIQSQEKNIGIVHYTNQSPANVYAEGFFNNSGFIELPTIRMGEKDSIGVKLMAIGEKKTKTELGLDYYDLGYDTGNDDINNKYVVVGKIFNDLKIFVIENQELLYALSYKSNRSWTLPNYTLDYK